MYHRASHSQRTLFHLGHNQLLERIRPQDPHEPQMVAWEESVTGTKLRPQVVPLAELLGKHWPVDMSAVAASGILFCEVFEDVVNVYSKLWNGVK